MVVKVRIAHTMLVVSNLECSLGFYRLALGLRLAKKRGEKEARARGASSAMAFVADDAGHGIELKQPLDGPAQTGAGFGHVAVLSDDLDAMLQRLRDRGLEPYNVREQLGMRMALVRDPDGHVVELIDRASYLRWWEDPKAGL